VTDEHDAEWRRYEEQIHGHLVSKFDRGAIVTFDKNGEQTLRGRFSEIERQIDIIVRGRYAGGDLGRDVVLVVDCKHWSKKLAVPHVEAFAGLVDDVGGDLGLLITSSGYSEAATKRAAHTRGIFLDVVAFEELAAWQPPPIWLVFCERCGWGSEFPGEPAGRTCPSCGQQLTVLEPR
jgi:hypothetical protein